MLKDDQNFSLINLPQCLGQTIPNIFSLKENSYEAIIATAILTNIKIMWLNILQETGSTVDSMLFIN